MKGQVLGGRWKPLHYFLRNALYADVIATCGTDANCFVKNDGVQAFTGTVTISAVNLASGKLTTALTKSVSLAAGAGVTQWFCLSYHCHYYESMQFDGLQAALPLANRIRHFCLRMAALPLRVFSKLPLQTAIAM